MLVFLENDVEIGSAILAYLYFLGDETQIRDFECLSALGCEGKVTVKIGNCTQRSTLNLDAGTNQRLVVRTGDNRTRNVLSIEDTCSDS